ncbi:MAG TPA: hypothetical protein VFB72_17915 [Verrucomicrobiae bacterium]|nr:hypothetical protein [Verrucomicrobiae bacterium]
MKYIIRAAAALFLIVAVPAMAIDAQFQTDLTTLKTDLQNLQTQLNRIAPDSFAQHDMKIPGQAMLTLASQLSILGTAGDLENALHDAGAGVATFTVNVNNFRTTLDTSLAAGPAVAPPGIAAPTAGWATELTTNLFRTASLASIIINSDLANLAKPDLTDLQPHLVVLAKRFKLMGLLAQGQAFSDVAADEAVIRRKANQSGSPWQISLWTGARMSTPYSINVSNNTGRLGPAGTSTDGYIEFELNNRYVIRPAGSSDLIFPFKCLGGLFTGTSTDTNGIPHFFSPLGRFPDIDARVGYTFRGNGSPTNFNVSTVAGGSDIYGDTSLGFPFGQVAGVNDSWKGQLTIDIAGGFATDKQHLDMHSDFFAGLGGQASFRAPGFGSTNYQGYWIGRAGYALIGVPSLISGTDIVNLNSLQEPKFNLTWVPSVGTTVVYPLNTWLSLQGGFNVYFTPKPPAEWNLNIGVTVNIDQVFGSLGK